MAAKTTELAKLLRKYEKKNPMLIAADIYRWSCKTSFLDVEDYISSIRKDLGLSENSDVYVFDMEDKDYMTQYSETLMKYTGKDISIQVEPSFVDTCDGEFDCIVLVVTRN